MWDSLYHFLFGHGNIIYANPLALMLAPAAMQAIGGGLQAAFSGVGRARRQYEDQLKKVQPDQGIMDYYSKALAAYSPNAYASQEYQQRMNQLRQSRVQGLSAAQDRRAGLQMIGATEGQFQRGLSRAASEAESAQRANLGRLGQAAGMAMEERFKPIKYNLQAAMQKYGQKAGLQQEGLQNIFRGLSSASYALQGQDLSGNKETRAMAKRQKQYNPDWSVYNQWAEKPEFDQ